MLPSLTGLRFILAAMVLVFHYARFQSMPGPDWLLGLVGNGFAAVSGFFVLSGFVLARNYITPEGELKGTRRGFWASRFARVYPVYFLSIVLVFQSYWNSPQGTGEKVLATITTLTGTQAWIPQAALAFTSAAWSLSVEGFLYLCFPVLLPLVHGPTRRHCCIAAICAFVSLLPPAALWFVTGSPSADLLALIRYNPLFHLPAFVAGMVAEQASRRICVPVWIVWPALGLILCVLLVGRRIPYDFVNNGLLILPFSALILGLARERGLLSRLLSTRIFVQAGEASCSLYLLHLPLRPWVLALNDAVFRLDRSSWLLVSLGLVLCVIASLVAFRFVEEPYRRSVRAALTRG